MLSARQPATDQYRVRCRPAQMVGFRYVDYVDGIVLDGLFNVTFKSLSYLLDHMDDTGSVGPDGVVRALFAKSISQDGKGARASSNVPFF